MAAMLLLPLWLTSASGFTQIGTTRLAHAAGASSPAHHIVTRTRLPCVPNHCSLQFRCTFACRISSPIRAEAADPEENTFDIDEIESELRKALAGVPEDERRASDKRLIDAVVDDKKGDLFAVERDLAKKLESVQDAVDERVAGQVSGLQSSFLSKLEETLSTLQNADSDTGSSSASGSASGSISGSISADLGARNADGSLSATLGAGSVVVVVGGTSALGAKLIEMLCAQASSSGWTLRALVPDGAALNTAPEVSSVLQTAPFAPFAPSPLKKSIADADAVVVLSEAACGAGGVDSAAMGRLMKAIGERTRRLVYVSCHGVERTSQLPFSLQNVFGNLDKQRAAEQEAQLRAKLGIAAYSVVRIGKLKDDASAKRYLAEVAPGDALNADIGYGAAATSLLKVLTRSEAINATLSLASAPAELLAISDDDDVWDDQFLKLIGPELFRKRVRTPAAQLANWLREWALEFLKPGKKLTTPVQIVQLPNGVMLRFLSSGSSYSDFDEVEDSDTKWKQAVAKRAAAERGSEGKPDGALRIVAEDSPSPRVRVCRAEMGEGVVVKEMSEATVLQRLERDLERLEASLRG